MRFITLTSANIHITNDGTRLVWQPDISLLNQRIELVSICITGTNVDLYRLSYISRDDGSLWSNQLIFESVYSSVKCINVSSGYSYRYTHSIELAFNLWDEQFDPVQPHLNYSDVQIELAVDI
jgi:hypothetical protein